MIRNWKLWHFLGRGRQSMGFIGSKITMERGILLPCSKLAGPSQFKKELCNNQLQGKEWIPLVSLSLLFQATNLISGNWDGCGGQGVWLQMRSIQGRLASIRWLWCLLKSIVIRLITLQLKAMSIYNFMMLIVSFLFLYLSVEPQGKRGYNIVMPNTALVRKEGPLLPTSSYM